jgi:hypothetical protein
MRTTLKITIPSKGVPMLLLDEVEKALHAYYDDKHISKAWTLPGKPPARVWNIEIDMVPESEEDEVEADRIAGRRGEGRAETR